jgi:tetraacyldisaccharide 4'-kinase
MNGRASSKPAPFNSITRLWRADLGRRQRMLWLAMTPLAALYSTGVIVRRGWWRIFARSAPVTTISIGNLTVGGNAKTPFALFLARRLRHEGFSVGIVSRGYGAPHPPKKAALVAADGSAPMDPDVAGDEPAMLARAFGGPVAVGRRRLEAIALLKRTNGIDVAVLDDAFQHLRLRRDLDLLVIAGDRGLGNGWALPAGPMRESVRAARRADAIILVNAAGGEHFTPSSAVTRLLEQSRQPVFRVRLEPTSLVQSERGRWHPVPLALHNRRIVAVSGLADPRSFYAMLRQLEADLVGVLEFPDHHRYTNNDWQTIRDAAREADAIITTEKDLVKLEKFPFPRDSLYALRVEVVMEAGDEARLIQLVSSRIAATKRLGRA